MAHERLTYTYGVNGALMTDTILVEVTGVAADSATVSGDPRTGGGIHVTNSGRIDGDLLFGRGQNIVGNLRAGTWKGDLRLGINEDVVLNSGSVQSDVALGAEDDLFDGRGGSVTGIVDGGTGYDMIFGGSRSDRLIGGDGNDWIHGGGKSDELDGGAGRDVFAYSALSDSTAAARDTITGFQSGVDRIDLGALKPSSEPFAHRIRQGRRRRNAQQCRVSPGRRGRRRQRPDHLR